jgi:hypothetical protein
MATVTFDTLDATRKLRDAGFDEAQAETVVRVLAASHEGLIIRERFDAKIAVIEAKMDKLSWMIGVVIAIAAANFAKQFFLGAGRSWWSGCHLQLCVPGFGGRQQVADLALLHR